MILFSLLVCCSCINSKPTDSDQLNEHQIDSVYPAFLITDDLVERAAPRLGRASPRLGRASPRLGRQAAYILPRLNHAGRYFLTDEEALYDNPEVDFYFDAKRAAPRLGRSA